MRPRNNSAFLSCLLARASPLSRVPSLPSLCSSVPCLSVVVPFPSPSSRPVPAGATKRPVRTCRDASPPRRIAHLFTACPHCSHAGGGRVAQRSRGSPKNANPKRRRGHRGIFAGDFFRGRVGTLTLAASRSGIG